MIFQRPVVRARKPIRNRANPGCSGWRERSLFRRGSLGVEPLEERALLALLSVPGTFATIGLALAAAVPNVDTIEIDGGVYPEAVSVNVNVTLQAKPATGTVIADSFTSTAPTTVSLSGDFQASTVAGFNWLGPVNIVEDTTLTAAFASAPITFASTVQSPAAAKALTTNAAGAASFLGVVGGGGNELASLTIGANTGTLKNVTTAGVQNYTGAANVTLNGTYTTGGNAFTVNGPALIAGTTIIQAGVGAITFGGTVKSTGGPQTLTANSTDLTSFQDEVGGGGNALSSLTTNAGGDSTLKSVTTSGLQNYLDDSVTLNGTYTTNGNEFKVGGPAILAGTTTINTGLGPITFNSTIAGGGFNLTLSAMGTTTLGGAVSAVNTLTSNNTGSTVVNDTISTTTTLVMVDPVQLNGGSVTTTGDQTYSNTITLGNPTVLKGANLTLATVLGGGFNLTLNGALLTTLGGPISGVAALKSNSGGTTLINNTISANSLLMVDTVTLNVTSLGVDVSTTEGQTYKSAVTLAADTILAASTVVTGILQFDSSINGANFNLTLSGAGTTTLGAAVFGVNALTSNNVSGTTRVKSTVNAVSLAMVDASTLEGGPITTTGNQVYTGTITLAADTTLNGVDLTLGAVVGAGFDLTLHGTGLTTLGGAVSGVDVLTSNSGGTTAVNSTISATTLVMVDAASLNGGTITTTGDQTYSNTVTLGANTVMSGANLTLATVLGGGFNLTLNGALVTTLGGPVSNVGALASNNPGTTIINNTINANSLVIEDAVTFNVAPLVAVTTFAGQTYKGPVTLAANTILETNDTATGILKFESTITGAGFNLTLNGMGLTTLGGAVSNVNTLTSNAGGQTQVQSPISATTLVMVDAASLNGGTITTTGDQTYSNTVTLGANTVMTGANLTLATVLGGGFNLTLSGALLTTFGGPVSNVAALKSNNGGTTIVNNTISANSLEIEDAATLNVAPLVAVTTFAGQTYKGPVTLAANTILETNDTATGILKFESIIIGANFNLTLSGAGTTTLGGAVFGVNGLTSNKITGPTVVNSTISAGSLVMSDASTLGGGTVTTTGNQTYTGTITLAADTTLNGVDLTLGTVVGAGFDLTLHGTGITTLGGAVSGVDALTSNSGGTTKVNNTINASSLSIVDPATLSGGVITTSGSQTYGGAVTLGANTVLTTTTAAGTMTFNSTITGAGFDLTLSARGTTTLGGAVSGVNALVSNNLGTTVVNGPISAVSVEIVDASTLNVAAPLVAVTTSGNQTYTGPVTLGANTILTTMTAAGNLTFNSTITGAGFNLTLNGRGTTTLGGVVSGVNALTSSNLGTTVVNAAINAGSLTMVDPSTLNGGTITTTGNQSYTGPITLGADTTLTGFDLTLAAVVGANFDLTLKGTGTTTLNGAVSGVDVLTSNNGGTTVVNATISAATLAMVDSVTLNVASPLVAVTTSLNQTYSGAVTLAADTTLTTTTAPGNQTFLSTITGAGFDLKLLGMGTTTLNGAISGVDMLTSNNGGTTVVNATINCASLVMLDASTLAGGTITTTGNQTFMGTVTLGANTTLNAQSLSLNAVVGAGFHLTLHGSMITTLNGIISGVNTLTSNSGGTTTVNNTINAAKVLMFDAVTLNVAAPLVAVTTSGDQMYASTVTLGANTILAGVNITFLSTVDSNGTAHSLVVNGSGLTAFAAAVGNKAGGPRLTSLTTDLAGTTAIGGIVNTNSNQIYNDAVRIDEDITLNAFVSPGTPVLAAVTFGNTVEGLSTGEQALVINANVLFKNAVGKTNYLESLSVIGSDASHLGTTEFNMPAGPNNVLNTNLAQLYSGPVLVDTDTVLNTTATSVVPATTTLMTFAKTIVGPGGLTTNTKGTTSFQGTIGGATPLKFLDVTTGGPLVIKVNVTAANNISLKATRLAEPAVDDDLTVGDALNPATVNKILSNLGNIEIHSDNDLTLLANSIIEATQGSISLKGDLNNKSADGSRIMLAGTVKATTAGKNVTVEGNTHDDTITLKGLTTSPTINVNGNGGLDTINVEQSQPGTITNITGGDSAPAGNNITVNIFSPANTIDTIQGTLNIKGSPVDKLPPTTRSLVAYSPFSVSAGSPPPGIPVPPAVLPINVLVGNIVNVVDTNRALAANNVYTLSGSGFTRTGAAPINFTNDASNKFGIQTFTLKAGTQGNNKFQVQLPESIAARPLTHIDIDGGQAGPSNTNVNSNVLSVTGAKQSAIQVTGTIGGAPVSLNTIIAGDGSANPGHDEPIKFSHVKSLYLTGSTPELPGSTGADFMVNNSTSPPSGDPNNLARDRVFAVFDGRGGGDWMYSGIGPFAQDVMYGGGAPAGRSVFMFGRGTSVDPANPNGFFAPNQSLNGSDATSIPGSSFIDGGVGLYSAVATNGKVNNVVGNVFIQAGSLNVVSWLRADFKRTSSGILDDARDLIADYPNPGLP